MAANPTESTLKCGPEGKKRKLSNIPSSQDCKKVKDEFDDDNSVMEELKSEELKKPEEVSSSEDYKKCKEECVKDDSVTNKFKSKELEEPEKVSISCANCGFEADSEYDFPLKVFYKDSISFYCEKEECQDAGFPAKYREPKKKCGLCPATEKLTKTECCDNWICYPVKACRREHERYSMCGYHFNQDHGGNWRGCKKCEDDLGDCAGDEGGIPISCVNCGFTDEEVDAFPLRVTLTDLKSFDSSTSYYCAKEKCQKAGLPRKSWKDSIKVKEEFGSDDCVKSEFKSEELKKPEKILAATESTTKCESQGKNRTSSNTPSSQDSIKVKEEFGSNDCVTKEFKSEDKKKAEKVSISISCANCDFEADNEYDFPLQVFSNGSNSYYCEREECQDAGFPSRYREPPYKCGLCSETENLMKTECCDNWVCSPYCCREHERNSLCGYHFNEGHGGHWKDCKKCEDDLGQYVGDEGLIQISCVNCGFTDEAVDAFPLRVILTDLKSFYNSVYSSTSYYCAKEKCQKAGLPAKST